MPSGERKRWPQSVYGVGQEPDPRFTLANERTFLAWIRTVLAFVAAGVAIGALIDGTDGKIVVIVSSTLIAMALVVSIFSYQRWMASERALRLNRPLPQLELGSILGFGLSVVALLALVLVIQINR